MGGSDGQRDEGLHQRMPPGAVWGLAHMFDRGLELAREAALQWLGCRVRQVRVAGLPAVNVLQTVHPLALPTAGHKL